MGPLIDLCVQRGHQVLLAYASEIGLGDKTYQAVDPTKLANFAIAGCKLLRVEEVDDLHDHSLDVLVTIEGFYSLNTQLKHIGMLRSNGTRVVSLTHFFEIAKQPLDALDAFDKTYYISEFARDLHFELQAKASQVERAKKKYAHKFQVSGSPMFDPIGGISREAAKRELGIPDDVKTVLLVAPVISPITPWRYHVWEHGSRLKKTHTAMKAGQGKFIPEIWLGKPFHVIMQRLRKLCDRESAWLVIKSRGKQQDPAYMKDNADVYLTGMEDEYYPVFTTYKLQAAADLCITVNSMAAAEAVAVGVPCINIYVPHLDLATPWTSKTRAYHTRLLGGAPGSLMNYQGAVIKIDRRNAGRVFSRKRLADFSSDADRRKKYVREFLGIEEKSSSERIAASLEELISEKKDEYGSS